MDNRVYAIESHTLPIPSVGALARGGQMQQPGEAELLRMALNQVDYGLVVLDANSGEVQFANGPGHAALDDGPDGHQGRVVRQG